MKNIEQELKLSLTESEYRKISELSQALPRLQTNYYFVSSEISAETMVRLREKSGTFLLCCKNRILQNYGVSVCEESECEVEKSFAESLIKRGLMPYEINSMLKMNFQEPLYCVGKMDTYRTTFMLEEWRLELDKNLYLDKCDYELECECDDKQSLENLKRFLASHFNVEIKYSKPKSQRFFETKEEM